MSLPKYQNRGGGIFSTNVELGWRFLAQYSACRTLYNLFSSSNQTRIILDNILISQIIKWWLEVELKHQNSTLELIYLAT